MPSELSVLRKDRFDPELDQAIIAEAARRGVSRPTVVRDACCEHLGLPLRVAHPTEEQRRQAYWGSRRYLPRQQKQGKRS